MWPKGERMTNYQEEILGNLYYRKREAVMGPHGLGKTFLIAVAILGFALPREDEDWKVPTTASSWRQLEKYLWPEIRKKVVRMIRWDRIGREPFNAKTEMTSLSLKLRGGEAFAVASDQPELIEGVHANSVLYIFDESKMIGERTFDAAEGAFSNAGEDSHYEAYALACSTPGEPVGRFFDIMSQKPGFTDWYPRSVSLDEAMKAGRINSSWVEKRKLQWGEKSSVFQNRVMGVFASNDIEGVINGAHVDLAMERGNDWRNRGKPGTLIGIGVDVARSGEDKTVIARLYEERRKVYDINGNAYGESLHYHIDDLEYTAIDTNVETARRVSRILRGSFSMRSSIKNVIDSVGLGAGVIDILRDEDDEYYIYGLNGNGEANKARDVSGELKFRNKRAHLYWYMRDCLNPDLHEQVGFDISLPDDIIMQEDLITPRWKETSNGKIQIEAKEDMSKRSGRSPDAADAVGYAIYVTYLGRWEQDEVYVGNQNPWG